MPNTQPFISFTPAATHYLKKLIHQTSNCQGVRISIINKNCMGLSYDLELTASPNTTDLHWEDKAFSVFIPPTAQPILQGTVVDLKIKTLGQSEIVFNNPNVDQACGCGKSFNIKEHNRSLS